MGQKYAAYDIQRNIIGFYDGEISPVPAGVQAVAITDDQWQMLLAGQSEGKRMALDLNLTPILLDPLPPTQDQIVAMNTAKRDQLLQQASVALAPLQMAVSLGEATDAETVLAKAWVAFSRAVKAVDLTQANATWPQAPRD
ncbi:tail fiber assembly protein [Burkholderia alba]|uniref:tail fiber assembly protein n=1 Tax=Burkholderia alba TaxID=2683677 RepID=UPI002B061AA9|nr:tail fiber assembly protein [Burkholderia alba]